MIAAYKTLGGSFTGDITVDPTHRHDLHRREVVEEPMAAQDLSAETASRSDGMRRIRDAVEAALSDIILLGTEEHVRLAERAIRDLVAGRPVHTHDLVVSLRAFVREALDLAPIPANLTIPMQGPPVQEARAAARAPAGKSTTIPIITPREAVDRSRPFALRLSNPVLSDARAASKEPRLLLKGKGRASTGSARTKPGDVDRKGVRQRLTKRNI